MWKNEKLFLSHTLNGELVGLEEIDDGTWSLYHGSVLLVRFDERERDSMGRHVLPTSIWSDDASVVERLRDRTFDPVFHIARACELSQRFALSRLCTILDQSPFSAFAPSERQVLPMSPV
jgi:hypothetical protein